MKSTLTTTYTHEVVLCSYNMATKQDVEIVISRHKSREAMIRAFDRQAAMGRNVVGRKIAKATSPRGWETAND